MQLNLASVDACKIAEWCVKIEDNYSKHHGHLTLVESWIIEIEKVRHLMTHLLIREMSVSGPPKNSTEKVC